MTENRLYYKEYHGCNDIITIDLNNGYSIIAIKSYSDFSNNYVIELRITENSVNKWDIVNDYLTFDGNTKNINSAILKRVSDMYNDGFFDYYINRYEYELKCFDIGVEIYEKNMEV